jgi:hypothetical protein
LNLIIAFPPDLISEASAIRAETAYTIYRIGRDGHLYRADTEKLPSGGVMVLDDGGNPFSGSPVLLAGEAMREASARRCSGILLDLSKSQSNQPGVLASLLSSECKKHSIRLFVPEHLAQSSDQAIILVETAISSGSLQRNLHGAVTKYQAERVALDIERIRLDITLPSTDGQGQPLSAAELKSLMVRYGARSFFSPELCAWYFNYRVEGKLHFVLYDDLESIRRKITLASRFGISRAILYYPEVSDIIKYLTN